METLQGAAMNSPVADVRSLVSEQEWNLRVDLAAAYRLVAQFGWDDLIFTHISVRIPGPEHHFLINPYGMLFDEITASSLVKIDMQGKIVLDTGYRINAAGFTIHSAIHEAREDVICALHVHTPDGTAVATAAEGLLPLNQTAQLVINDLAYHDFEGVAFDLDERPRLQRNLGTRNAMILRNHGTLTVGATVGAAFSRMYLLERACTMQVRTLSMGLPLTPITESASERTASIATADTMGRTGSALVWPALLRKLDRISPDYSN
jgi:ribulose-5-phosphate 4-epimerase/fuculose-1-phosphate aldolase